MCSSKAIFPFMVRKDSKDCRRPELRECEEQRSLVELRHEGLIAITGDLFLEFPRLVHIRESADANAKWSLAGNLIDKHRVVSFAKLGDQGVGLRGTFKRTHLNRIARA